MGHLFVTRGDLTKLACDCILIPCDSKLNVNPVWSDLLPANLPVSRDNPQWRVLPGRSDSAGTVELPAVDGRTVRAVVTVDSNKPATPELVAERAWRALRHVADGLTAREGRAAALIGLSLPGVGHGGLRGERAKVIDQLLRRQRATPLSVDVALILRDRRDFAAMQARRNDQDWSDLSEELRAHADRLGELAAQGELSLFLGAGVSAPVGLPSWWGLLQALASAAGQDLHPDVNDPYRAAEPIVQKLGDQFHDVVKNVLDKRLHGVGHALLASLNVKQMVTSNFDACMEVALQPPVRETVRVLTREIPSGGAPWLLKINGDIEQPGSILLTKQALERHPEERRALEGVVQSLLLTSHLLFVGFSLTDDNFLAMAEAVSKVRQRAHASPLSMPGTALALTAEERDRAKFRDLHLLAMEPRSTAVGARTLEIFLDRLVWAAARQSDLANEYLLDKRYANGLSGPDRALRDLLESLATGASDQARSSGGWKRIAECLRSLGADETLVSPCHKT